MTTTDTHAQIRFRFALLITILGFLASALMAPAATATTAKAPVAVGNYSAALAAGEWDVIKYYDVKNTSARAPLRRGTSTWGYTHLINRGRWCYDTDKHIKSTLLYYDSFSTSGTSKTYYRWTYTSVGGWRKWSVVIEWGKGAQGLITAYNNLNRYCPAW